MNRWPYLDKDGSDWNNFFSRLVNIFTKILEGSRIVGRLFILSIFVVESQMQFLLSTMVVQANKVVFIFYAVYFSLRINFIKAFLQPSLQNGFTVFSLYVVSQASRCSYMTCVFIVVMFCSVMISSGTILTDGFAFFRSVSQTAWTCDPKMALEHPFC
jgi:hypothetical protein